MEKESSYRIKEIALHEGGSNIWFYPQYLHIEHKTKTRFFRKNIVVHIERWCNFYAYKEESRYFMSLTEKEDIENIDKIVGFDNKQEAEDAIIKINNDKEEYVKKCYALLNKKIGALVNNEGDFKTHKVNL